MGNFSFINVAVTQFLNMTLCRFRYHYMDHFTLANHISIGNGLSFEFSSDDIIMRKVVKKFNYLNLTEAFNV